MAAGNVFTKPQTIHSYQNKANDTVGAIELQYIKDLIDNYTSIGEILRSPVGSFSIQFN